MLNSRSNIILIGMPGAGKSTVGVLLAEQTARQFVDTDVLIEAAQGVPLQSIVDQRGHLVLREIEAQALCGLNVENHVIATGGSAVYSDAAMQHLKTNGIAVFLDVNLAALESRIQNFSTRGLAKRPNQSFADLFAERNALYTQYADITIQCSDLTPAGVCAKIIAAIASK